MTRPRQRFSSLNNQKRGGGAPSTRKKPSLAISLFLFFVLSAQGGRGIFPADLIVTSLRCLKAAATSNRSSSRAAASTATMRSSSSTLRWACILRPRVAAARSPLSSRPRWKKSRMRRAAAGERTTKASRLRARPRSVGFLIDDAFQSINQSINHSINDQNVVA